LLEPLKTPFCHNKNQNGSNKKALSNPFGVLATFDTDVQLDQSPNQSPALKNPYEQSSYYPGDETQLEGSISLITNDGPQKPRHSETDRQSQNYKRHPNDSNEFAGFEPASQHYEPSFVKNNSLFSNMMSFVGLLGNNQQARNGQHSQEYDEENEPPLLEGKQTPYKAKVIYNSYLDLGIDPKLIKMRTLSVLKFQKCQEEFVREPDMSGPLFLVLVFGMLLLFVIVVIFT